MAVLGGGFDDIGKELTDELILCLMTDRSARYDACAQRSEANDRPRSGCAAVGDAELSCAGASQDVQDGGQLLGADGDAGEEGEEGKMFEQGVLRLWVERRRRHVSSYRLLWSSANGLGFGEWVIA